MLASLQLEKPECLRLNLLVMIDPRMIVLGSSLLFGSFFLPSELPSLDLAILLVHS